MKVGALPGLVRPFTLLAPVVGTACAAGVASEALGAPWATPSLGYALLSAAAATGASNAWNQAFDVELDRVNKPRRPIPSGRATFRGAIVLGDVLALLALLLGALASSWFLACVAVGILGTWIYSAPPLRTKRYLAPALLTIAIPRGLLVPVAGWSVVAPPAESDPWALGVVAGLYVLGAAATKDFSDIEGDRAHGCRTLPVALGVKRAARIVAPFLVVPFALYPAFGALGWLHAPYPRLVVLATVLMAMGAFTAWALIRDARRLAWIGMYLLLLASQIGTWLAYR